jgi:mannose-1-phosphate guanylyltransferase
MIIVIIAGGSGTRLWPISTPHYPKHLLTVNGRRSLLQNTYDRAKKLTDRIYIVPEIGHIQHVREQLPELPDEAFVVEPARRGTANCVVAALSHISQRDENPDEAIAFIAADHYIRDVEGFAHSFHIAEAVSRQDDRIVLIGVEPDYPATGFGYIQKGSIFNKQSFVFNVSSFKEKPAYEVAQEYVKSGNYLWNCSYFVGSLNAFRSNIQRHAATMHKNYEKLLSTKTAKEYEKTYLDFENNTIDYELIEHVDNLLVVPASFDWMDLGSYGDMHKAVERDKAGNHINGKRVEVDGVENSFIQNSEEKPVAVIGLDNVVVVNTPDGVLVARKDLAQKVGEISKRLNGI